MCAPSTTLLIIICIRGVQSEHKFFFTAYKYICNRINTGSGDTKNGGTFSEQHVRTLFTRDPIFIGYTELYRGFLRYTIVLV